MPYEVAAIGETQHVASRFENLIHQQVTLRGNQNVRPETPPNRYQAREDESFEDDIWLQFPSDGSIRFGRMWLTHAVDIEDLQLIYAYRPPALYKLGESGEALNFLSRVAGGGLELQDGQEPVMPTANLYVHQFNEDGMVTRTDFTEHESAISKSRETSFDRTTGFWQLDLRKPLDSKETRQLMAVIADPQAELVALRSLVTLTKSETRAVHKAHREQAKLDAEHRERMEAFDRARTKAAIAIKASTDILRSA